MRKMVLISFVFLSFLTQARAAEIKLFVGGAMAEPIRKLSADFARAAGHQIDFKTGTTGALQSRLRAGEKADVIVATAAGIDALTKENRIVPGTRVDLARGLVGVAIRAGATAPDLSSAEAFKKAMLAAKSVSYVDPKAGGTSGTYLAGLFEKMGIADGMRKKTVLRNQGAEVADAVARGEAELGMTFISELVPNKGVRIASALPDAIQLPTVYAAAVLMVTSNPDAARAFVESLKTQAAARVVKEAGLEALQGR
jgi:molybdate transport system substrate-binding protein